MSTKKFKDINIDQVFTYKNTQYKKIPEKKISCCKRLNACAVGSKKTEIQINPLEDVEVDDNEQK